MSLNRRNLLMVVGASLAVRPAWAITLGSGVTEADFVAIGERHDNPDHHRIQAEIVQLLNPRGIAFEMIPRAREQLVNDMRASGASSDEIGPAIEWEESGWPDWSHYAPILDAAPEAYVAGGALSKAELGAIYANGASGLGEDMAMRYGLDQPLAEAEREAMLDEQFEAHCRMMDRAQLGPMVEVQRAWDAAYAEAWRRASRMGGGPAVLICGNVHALLDRGAPAYLAKVEPDARIAGVGLLEEGDPPPSAGEYTITFTSPRPEREDPCEQMREAMEKKG